MSKIVTDDIERTGEYCQFIEKLNEFHRSKGTTLLSEPVLGGKKIDLHKLYNVVIAAGGFNEVTKKRSWKQIGNGFDFPATCTNSAYILKGVYIRNLLGWEEENVWHKEWIPPEELKGPEAHKASTLAGKSFKRKHQKSQQQQQLQNQDNQSLANYEPFILPNNMVKGYQSAYSSAPILPLNLITNTEQHQCAISERHHRVQPSQHVHSTNGSDVDMDCAKATQFDESARTQIIPALQSNDVTDIEAALNSIVTISYEVPEKILLTENPSLLNTLTEIADTCLNETMFDENPAQAAYNNSKVSETTLLKILHILRNFSFVESNTRVFAGNTAFKQMLLKCLVTPSLSHYSHCIDILENMTPFIDLGPFDCIIGCLNHLITNLTDRSVILGSIRILTILASRSNMNFQYLLPTSSQITNKITQFLMIQDEELIGTCLEYLYQYSKLSVSFGQHLLSLHHGADLGILISFLMAPCKYFKPLLLSNSSHRQQPPFRQNIAETMNYNSKGIGSDSDAKAQPHRRQNNYCSHGSTPCVPNLELYQTLDEPYRCLGWLKDKFELAGPNNELSLDDMYLLYETRFGHEKALRIKDFYTVLKIAFPIVTDITGGQSTPITTTPAEQIDQQQQYFQNGARLEGTTIRGLQIKMCILQDNTELMCQWNNCSESFHDEELLQNHILNKHMTSRKINGNGSFSPSSCQWSNDGLGNSFRDKQELSSHIKASHFMQNVQQKQVQQQQQKNFDSVSGFVDHSDIQGVALVAAQLLNILSQSTVNSHMLFMPYERELMLMKRKRPKLSPFIDAIFSNFRVS